MGVRVASRPRICLWCVTPVVSFVLSVPWSLIPAFTDDELLLYLVIREAVPELARMDQFFFRLANAQGGSPAAVAPGAAEPTHAGVSTARPTR